MSIVAAAEFAARLRERKSEKQNCRHHKTRREISITAIMHHTRKSINTMHTIALESFSAKVCHSFILRLVIVMQIAVAIKNLSSRSNNKLGGGR
jgi:hypothetical protein